MEGYKAESVDSEPTLDMEKMGTLFQVSGVVKLEGGGEFEPSTSLEDKKTFGRNNNLLSFVTEGGVQYVTKLSSEKINDLMMAGYKEKSLGVPFSNGEQPIAGSQAYTTWDKMMNG